MKKHSLPLLLVASLGLALPAIAQTTNLSSAKPTDPVIRTGRFELVDQSGKVCLVITATPNGAAGIFAPNETRPLLVLGTKPSGDPVLLLADATGSRHIQASTAHDRAFLTVDNREGYAASITALPNQVGIGLNDPSKGVTAFLTVNGQNPGLNLNRGKVGVVLGSVESSSGLYVNGSSKEKASISVIHGVGSGVDLMNADGKRRGISTEGDQR